MSDGTAWTLGTIGALALGAAVVGRRGGSRTVPQQIVWLKKYLTMSPADEGREVAYAYPNEFAKWLAAASEDDEPFPRARMVARAIARRWHEDWSPHETVIDKVPAGVFEAFRNDLPMSILSDQGGPSFLHMEYEKLVDNQWMVHVTDHAHAIACNGFSHGMHEEDLERLGYPSQYTDKYKKGGTISFAYLADDVHQAAGRHGHMKWGDDAVLFRASGLLFQHTGDMEDAVVFLNTTATDRVPIFHDRDTEDYNVGSGIRDRPLFRSRDIGTVVDWVIANFNQYRRHLLCVPHFTPEPRVPLEVPRLHRRGPAIPHGMKLKEWKKQRGHG